MDVTRRKIHDEHGGWDDDRGSLVGSPQALGRLFSGGVAFRFPARRLSPADRLKRRKAIFGSFTRAIAHVPHRLAVLRGAEGDRIVVDEKPPRSFRSAKKREARRLKTIRLAGMPGSNRKPSKGPSLEKQKDIARRERARLRHEEKTKAGSEATP